jgi:hypothetical protein
MDTQREGELVDRYINDLLQPFEQSSAHLILLRILIQPLRCSINVKKGHATTTIITFSTRISQIRKQRDEKEDGCGALALRWYKVRRKMEKVLQGR